MQPVSRAVLYLCLTAVFWGGAFVAGKIALAHLPPLTVAFWRFALGTVAIVVIWLRREGFPSLPRTGRAWAGVAGFGLFGVFGYNWFFFKGLALVEAGAAALVVTTNPALTALACSLLFRERLSAMKLLGFGLAAFGALTVLAGGDWSRLLTLRLGPGAGLLAVAVLCWVAYVVLGKIILTTVSPLAANAAAFVVALPFLAVSARLEAPLSAAFAAPWQTWGAIAFMGVLSSALAFVWFSEGIRVLGASRTSVFIYLVPGFSLLFARAFLGEPISLPKVLGGGLVVAGVVLTNLPVQSKPNT
jgi:drug/metabolite transporter (DMT)-like permease